MTATLDPLTLPLRHSRLIEASAGTGKTYTLAALYVRLVLGHGGENAFGRPLSPPDILVVTFTEAATSELRDRIRQRLAQAARCFHGQAAPDSHDTFLQRLLAEFEPADHAACADHLDAAAQWMDEAAIYTIHSFCHRMLRQHAFDSGSLFNLELSADEDLLREQAAQDYWRTFCYPLNAAQAQCLAEAVTTPDDLLATVRPLLGQVQHLDGDTAQPPAQALDAFMAARRTALQALKDQWRQWASELKTLFDRAWQDKRLTRKKPSTSAAINGWLDSLAAWADAPDAVSHGLENTKLFERLSVHDLQQASDAIDEIIKHPAIAALDQLRKPASLLPKPLPALLPHAVHWIARRFNESKRQRALIGFDDMLSRLGEALNGDNGAQLAAIIRTQFPVALIDEFQDTDPVQYDIFQRIYADQPDTGWLMIGDPKQAIYAFRGADVFTYLKARQSTQGRHHTLATNYRSASGLVNAVNHLFEHADKQPAGAFGLDGRIPFQPVAAHGQAAQFEVDGSVPAALTLWHLAPADDADDRGMSKGAYLREMAARCASEITRLLDLAQQDRAGFLHDGKRQPLRPADIAILVRDRNEASAIRQALAERSLRSVYLSDKDSVLATDQAADLLRWLRACAEPENERLLRAALATATLDLSWQQLLHWVEDETDWERQVELFRHYRALWRQRGVLPMLRQLFRDFDLPARLLSGFDGERSLTNLMHLAELLQTASGQLDGEQALIRWLGEEMHNARSGTPADEQVMRLESDADLIKVITIHKSKGLEYPLVFLPFICTFRKVSADRPPVRYHDQQGQLHISLTPDSATVARADGERLAEDMRLLYVAMTRARHACWLGIAPLRVGGRKGESHLHESAIGHMIAGGKPIAPDDTLTALQALVAGAPDTLLTSAPQASAAALASTEVSRQLGAARDYAGQRAEHWWIASYSALRKKQPDAQAPATVDDDILAEENAGKNETTTPAYGQSASVHDFLRGPLPGTFLHGLLEWAAEQGFERCRADDAEFISLLEERTRVRNWQAWVPLLAEWMQALVRTPFPLGEAPPVTLSGLAEQQAELEFWLPAHHVDVRALDRLVSDGTLDGAARPALEADQLNGMLKGFIDLTFAHQGRYYVADYKSNWLGDSDAAYTDQALARAVLEKRYDMQYCLYVLALHRLLRSRLASYDYDTHVGGSLYLFLRGIHSPGRGAFFERPSRQLIEALDALFAGEAAHA